MAKIWAGSKSEEKITTTTVLMEGPVKVREGLRMMSRVETSNAIIVRRPISRTQLSTPTSNRSILKDPTVSKGLHLLVAAEEAVPEKM